MFGQFQSQVLFDFIMLFTSIDQKKSTGVNALLDVAGHMAATLC